MQLSADQQFVIEIARLFCFVFAIACGTIAVVGGIAFYRSDQGAANSFSRIIKGSGILEIVTVILVAAATSNLRVLDKISSEATIGIFSGIVGYVLGGLSMRRDKYRDG